MISRPQDIAAAKAAEEAAAKAAAEAAAAAKAAVEAAAAKKTEEAEKPRRRNPLPPRGLAHAAPPPRSRCCLRLPKATVPALPMVGTIAATVASRAVPRNRPRRRFVLFLAPTPRP